MGLRALAEFDQRPQVLLVAEAGTLSGVPRHLCHLTKALRSHARITLISDTDEGGFAACDAKRVTHITVPHLAARSIRPRFLRALVQTLSLLAQSQTRLVWLHAPRLALILRLLLLCRVWRPQAPVAITYHATPYAKGHPLIRRLMGHWLERCILRHAPPHHIIYLTEQARQTAQLRFGARALRRHQTHILPNSSALGTAHLHHAAQTPAHVMTTLVMTTRDAPQKDLDHAFRLFAALPSTYRLTLAGPQTQTTSLRRRLLRAAPDAASRVTLLGPLHDIRPVLATADAYLMTSRYEGLPIGALEAMEMGLPLMLRDFEGADALIAAHPAALCLPMTNLAQDAAAITALLAHTRPNRRALTPQIQSLWYNQWSPDVFAPAAQRLLTRLLVPPHDQALPDAGPSPLPDLQRTATCLLPEPSPSYITAAPSGENG